MASGKLHQFRADVTKKLHEPNGFNNTLATVEQKTGVDRFYMVAGIAGLLGLYLVFGHFAELLCNFIGFLYPAYMSMKAVESTIKTDDTQWLTYWVVFGFLSVLEFAEDEIVAYFPIYFLVKCAFLLYLSLPMTLGAQKFYNQVIRPIFNKCNKTIEGRFNQAYNKASDAVKDGAQAFKNQ